MNNLARLLGGWLVLGGVVLAADSPKPPAALSPDAQLVAQGNTEFALALYQKLSQDRPGNLFFSPSSISTVLGMAWGGARGETAAQMEKALCLKLPQERFHAAAAELQAELTAIQQAGGVHLLTANSLWPQKGYPFRQEFLDLCQKRYAVELTPVDFLQEPEPARSAINDWAKTKTKNLIPELLPVHSVDIYTRLVLVNAIYFKGTWHSPFKPALTGDASFTTASGAIAKVPMMKQQGWFGYAEFPELQVLSLPYGRSNVSMIVLLPAKADGLPALRKQLTPETLKQWTGAAIDWREVKVAFPKFAMNQAIDLPQALQALGMTDAFIYPKADLSGMADTKELFISRILHQAIIKVDEQGTEAAAATGMACVPGCVPPPPPKIPIFRADHPFIFLISACPSGNLLFMGQFSEP
jgi:serpin B